MLKSDTNQPDNKMIQDSKQLMQFMDVLPRYYPSSKLEKLPIWPTDALTNLKKIDTLTNNEIEAIFNKVINFLTQLSVQENTNEFTPLFIAAIEGHNAIIEALLMQRGFDINKGDDPGNTPLHMSVDHKNHDAVKMLLDDSRTKVNQTNEVGRSPLHWAARGGDVKIVQMLLNHPKINPDQADKEGNTPLSVARSNKNTEVAALIETAILKNNIPQLKEYMGVLPTFYKEALTDLPTEAMDQLENADKLTLDEKRDNFNKVISFLARLSAENKTNDLSPLHIAALKGHQGVLKALLSHRECKINKVEEGSAPLHTAILTSKPDIVKTLLAQEDTDVNISGSEGRTPLYSAITIENLDMIEMLVNNPRVDVNKSDHDGVSPLILAVYKNRPDIVKMLLDNPKIKPIQADKEGHTPLSLAKTQKYPEITMIIETHIAKQKNDTGSRWGFGGIRNIFSGTTANANTTSTTSTNTTPQVNKRKNN